MISAPVSVLFVFSEPITFRVLPLDTETNNMTAPCQAAVKFAEPSHRRASTNVFTSDVVATTISSVMTGFGTEAEETGER